VIERLKLLASIDPEDLRELSSTELVQRGYCDPVRLFVKNEPHSSEKARAKRWRIISSVSIIDQLVERVLFRSQNQLEISLWDAIPSKPGLGLDTPEQIAQTWDYVRDRSYLGVIESDVSGWDWSVQGWELEAEAEMRVRLTQFSDGRSGDVFSRLVRNRFRCIAFKVLYLSDGRMIAQKVAGVMPSGSYITGSSNSRIRVLAANLVGAPWAMAMGDDCVEGSSVDTKLRYSMLGHPLKDVKTRSQGFEFCSHHFVDRQTAIPVNWGKTLYRLFSRPYDELNFGQFEHVLRMAPEALARSLEVARRVRWGPENNGKQEEEQRF